MRKRLWLSVAMLVLGTSLLVGASLATAASSSPGAKKGGILKYGTTGNLDSVDPQIAYGTTSWWMEFATKANLYTYPDKSGAAGAKLVPEVASGFKVSKNGKVYTLTIRKGFKFSDGTNVTAANFKYAINRAANKDLGSPGAAFITDSVGTNIVGAAAVNAGRGTNVSGVTAKGNKLTIRLSKPDGLFLTKMAMPFFQATSTKLPLREEVVQIRNIRDMPTPGPYAWSYNDPNRLAQLARNPHYKKGPGRNRPANLNGMSMEMRLNAQTAFNRVKANDLDLGAPPPAEIAGVVRDYGLSRRGAVKKTGRFWVLPAVCTFYQAMNMARPGFKPLKRRQAVNWAVDRKGYMDQRGLYGGQPWSHILPPGMLGTTKAQPYPLRYKAANLTKAKKLGNGSGRKLTYYYQSAGIVGPAQYQIALRDLTRLGYDVEGRGFAGFNIYEAAGTRGSNHDIVGQVGWCQDYPDPYDFINVLMDGTHIQAENNVNIAYFNQKKWNKAMANAAKKTGAARIKAYRKLDLDITKKAAPWAAMGNSTNQFFWSNRIAPKSMVYQTVYQYPSIPALALK